MMLWVVWMRAPAYSFVMGALDLSHAWWRITVGRGNVMGVCMVMLLLLPVARL
jgi:hypothetical protein